MDVNNNSQQQQQQQQQQRGRDGQEGASHTNIKSSSATPTLTTPLCSLRSFSFRHVMLMGIVAMLWSTVVLDFRNTSAMSTLLQRDVVVSSSPSSSSSSSSSSTNSLANKNSAAALPPVHKYSSWIGNTWIPLAAPSTLQVEQEQQQQQHYNHHHHAYRLYGPREFLQYFEHHGSVLVIGDSTARRTYNTLYTILEQSAAQQQQRQQQQQQAHQHSNTTYNKNGSSTQQLDRKETKMLMDHVTVQILNQNVDIGKSAPSPYSKRTPEEIAMGLADVRPMPTSSSTSSSSSTGDKQATFDLARTSCVSHLLSMAQNPHSILWRRQNSTLKHGDGGGASGGSTSATTTNFGNDAEPPYYSLIIFVIGQWDVMERIECGLGGRLTETQEFFKALLQGADDQAASTSQATQFVWRTWGTFGSSPGHNTPQASINGWKKAKAHNELVKKLLDEHERELFQLQQGRGGGGGGESSIRRRRSTVSYVDWGQAMLPRLFPQEHRIVGDIDPHYGLEARVAFWQMLLNHIFERERQERSNLTPWSMQMVPEVDEKENDDDVIGKTFLSTAEPKPVLEEEEQAEYDQARADFCPTCFWGGTYSCQARKDFMRTKYKIKEYQATMAVAKLPQCNSSSMTTKS